MLEVVKMSENIGILLKLNLETNEIMINNKWLAIESESYINREQIGKLVKYYSNEKNKIVKVEEIPQQLKEMKGKVQSMNLSIPRISMHVKGSLLHFYIAENCQTIMREEFKPGSFVHFFYHETEIEIGNVNYYVIANVKEEKTVKKSLPLTIKGDLRDTLESLLSSKYYTFLDLEFSMSGPEYRGKNFSPEIIQVGLIITDSKGNIVEKFSSYIKPTVFRKITDKTQEFLKINKMVVANGITYLQFYDYIKEIKLRYQPLFVVWGVSDGFILNSSCAMNNVDPLFEANQLVDLQRIHRQYYEIGQDIGLYNAMKSYGFFSGIQIHDALVDALILQNIFNQFKLIVEEKHEFPFKENYKKLLENR